MEITDPIPPKRKPGRPRKARNPDPGTQTPQPQIAEPNPLEAQIKAARSAYDPNRGTQTSQPSKSPETPKESILQATGSQATGMGNPTGAPNQTGAALPTPLPPLRVRGDLVKSDVWVKSLTEAQVEAFATAWVATGKRTKWLFQNSNQYGRENATTRGSILRELENHPVCRDTVARLTSEVVMSDLERRRKLREIAESTPHELRGYADNLKAIELDAKHDPESVENKRKAEASNSLTFNAPVSLFFMPSTQARAITQAPEPKHADAIEAQAVVATSSLPSSLQPTLPAVGCTP